MRPRMNFSINLPNLPPHEHLAEALDPDGTRTDEIINGVPDGDKPQGQIPGNARVRKFLERSRDETYHANPEMVGRGMEFSRSHTRYRIGVTGEVRRDVPKVRGKAARRADKKKRHTTLPWRENKLMREATKK